MIAFQLAIRYEAVRVALFRLKDEINATFELQSSKDPNELLSLGREPGDSSLCDSHGL